ncbi:MAG: hypothetical protein JW804_03060 [Sedimentisphaerales bacterium]|nr:hypothetical protein [Sedimentisphaerales bacterium]
MRMINRKNNTAKKAKGFILPFLILMMVILALIGYGMLSLSYGARLLSIRQTSDTYAIAAAEAGIIHAVVKMNDKLQTDEVWNNSSLILLNTSEYDLPNCDAKYSFGIIGDPDTGFVISATGTSGNATRTFYAMTILRGVCDYGILVKDKLVLKNGSLISAYNSDTGKSNLPTAIGNTNIESDKIDLDKATVNGDVLVGTGGDPEKIIKNPGIITGILKPMTTPAEFPPVKTPWGMFYKGSIIKQSVTLFGLWGSGKYSKVNLEKNNVLEIIGDVTMYVTGDFKLQDYAQIKIKDDGKSSLTLYIGGNFEAQENTVINSLTQKPDNFKIFGVDKDSQDIKFKCNSNIFCTVYAPDAKVEIDQDGNFFGSVVCDEFYLKKPSKFYHDRALTKDIDDEGVYFGISRWYEP